MNTKNRSEKNADLKNIKYERCPGMDNRSRSKVGTYFQLGFRE